MNEDVFNMSLRKFLKKVGVTSQREIEKAVRSAIDEGRIQGTETLQAEVTPRLIPGLAAPGARLWPDRVDRRRLNHPTLDVHLASND